MASTKSCSRRRRFRISEGASVIRQIRSNDSLWSERHSKKNFRSPKVYDKAGRLVTIRQNGQAVLEYVRDEYGEVVAERDALGRAHSMDRDARGNLQADLAPNGAITRYEYDAQDRRKAQIDGNGNRIRFDFDAFDRLEGQTDALGNGLHWQYDSHGRLTERGNGEQTVRSYYDKAGRPTRTAYGPPGEVVESKWDREGRLKATSTPVAACAFSRDTLGRVEALTMKGRGAEDQVLRFRYDALGRRTGLLLARQTAKDDYAPLQQTEQVFDQNGRLKAVLDDGRPAVSYGFDKAGRMTSKTFGNGMVAGIGFDRMGRLARMEYTGGPLKAPLLLTYEWDLAGQLTRRGWNGAVQRYLYDAAGQLLKVLDDATGAEQEAYVYDPAGNMLEKHVGGEVTRMAYNAANQLVSARSPTAAVGYRYDRAGRLTAETVTNLAFSANAVLTTRSTYGWLDKLIRLERADGVRVQYQYWPDGQLAAKIPELRPGAPTLAVERFLWDGLALLRRNDTVYVVEPHASGGVPVASHPAGQSGPLTWYLNDLLGTTLATIEGDRVALRPLTAFGQPLRQKAALAPPGDLKPAAPPTFLPKT